MTHTTSPPPQRQGQIEANSDMLYWGWPNPPATTKTIPNKGRQRHDKLRMTQSTTLPPQRQHSPPHHHADKAKQRMKWGLWAWGKEAATHHDHPTPKNKSRPSNHKGQSSTSYVGLCLCLTLSLWWWDGELGHPGLIVPVFASIWHCLCGDGMVDCAILNFLLSVCICIVFVVAAWLDLGLPKLITSIACRCLAFPFWWLGCGLGNPQLLMPLVSPSDLFFAFVGCSIGHHLRAAQAITQPSHSQGQTKADKGIINWWWPNPPPHHHKDNVKYMQSKA